MNYGNIMGVNIPVSRLVLGCAALSSDKNAFTLLDAAVASGINTFDTAHIYSGSEKVLGIWLEGQKRSEIVIQTKCGHPGILGKERVSRKFIVKDLESSLQQLRTSYVDILMLHRDQLSTPVDELVEVLNKLYDQKKVRAFGGSNWSIARLAQANEYAYKHNLIPFTVSSPNFGLAHQVKDPWGGGAGAVTITGDDMTEARKWYQENQLSIIAFSALGRGFFTGKVKSDDPKGARKQLDFFARKGYCYPENFERLKRAEILAEEKGCSVAQIAIAWIFTRDLNVYAIFATTNPKRIESNVASLDIKISQEESAWLNLERDFSNK